MMKKAKIIVAVFKEVRGRDSELAAESVLAYEQHLTAELERNLSKIDPDLDLPTCANFSYLGVECCPVCHLDYPAVRIGRRGT